MKCKRVYRQRVKRQSPPPMRNFSQELGNVVRYDLLEIKKKKKSLLYFKMNYLCKFVCFLVICFVYQCHMSQSPFSGGESLQVRSSLSHKIQSHLVFLQKINYRNSHDNDMQSAQFPEGHASYSLQFQVQTCHLLPGILF